jgi:ribosomal protein L21
MLPNPFLRKLMHKYIHTFYPGQKYLCHFCNFTKLPKVDSHPLGEISPNPVTLVTAAQILSTTVEMIATLKVQVIVATKKKREKTRFTAPSVFKSRSRWREKESYGARHPFHQGCQMEYFQTKNSQFG